jgi:ketosteroid isomerase-like protein
LDYLPQANALDARYNWPMTASEGSPLEKLHALYAEWADGEMSRSDIFDPEVESESFGVFPEGDTSVRGREELSSLMLSWLRTWRRPLTITAEEFIQSGDRILVLIRWKGAGRGSGAEVEAAGAHLWSFRDGRAVRFDVYRDRDEARKALDRTPEG